MSIRINKEDLISIVGGYGRNNSFEVVYSQISDTSRWSIYYDCIIKDCTTGKFYDASYTEGATEMQDESPFEYDPVDDEGNIELREVEPYETIVTRYRIKDE